MKTIRAFIIGVTVFVCIAGCSTPSPKVVRSQRPAPTTAATVEDARLLYEMGRLDDAQHKLQAVLAVEPDNQKAQYYLALVHRSQELKPQPRGYYQTIPQQPIY
jgi:Tfp pilus assembly protein PilF